MEPARLQLTQGRIALVDAEDLPRLTRHSWRYLVNDRGGYAVRDLQTDDGRKVTIYLHRFLLSARPGELVDHRNGDGLDNQRHNLRLATPSQNGANRPGISRDIPYRGVYRQRGRRSYFAAISIDGKVYRLGTFPTMEAAARAYDRAAWRAFGRFARLNFPGEQPPAVEQLSLALDLGDVDEVPALAVADGEELPAIELGKADWYEYKMLQRWRSARVVEAPAATLDDDDLL